jgi:2-oxoisovalerate dehydrogenase E1 component
VYPSTADDAKGLLKTACRSDDPVLFCEHKGLYRQGFASAPEPGPDYLIPFGLARIRKSGEDVTVITWGMLVQRSLDAARRVEERHGGSVEVIDLRTLNPLDRETILRSVRKTGKVLIVHEDTLTGGFGGEIAAIIAGECFEHLDAPVRRVAAKDTPVPYGPELESAMLPQETDVVRELEVLLKY